MDYLKKIREAYNVDLLLEHSLGTDKEAMTYYHFHNVYEIYLPITSGAEMWIGNQHYEMYPNNLILLSTSDQHRIIVNDRKGYDRYVLYFNPLCIQPFSSNTASLLECFGTQDSKRTYCLKLSSEESRKLVSLYSCYYNLKDNENFYALEIKQKILLIEILIYINEIFIKGLCQKKSDKIASDSHRLLMPIMDYIGANYDKDLNTQQIAKSFGFDRHSLNRLFKDATGISFHKYLINTRIIKARELLMQGGISTTQACYESGFNDYANFIRTFSNIVGVPPGKYAKQYQKGNSV